MRAARSASKGSPRRSSWCSATAKSGTAESHAIAGIDPTDPIGLFGGTFDPVHRGHLHAAEVARDRLGLAEVRLILSARPPHRGGPVASVEHRWQMLTRATRGRRGLHAEDCEIRRDTRPSYTVDTLTGLREQLGPARPLVWCIGWDAFVELETWKDWTLLVELAHIAVFRRPGPTVGPTPALEDLLERRRCDDPALLTRYASGRITVLDATMLPISATQVRAELARNADVSRLLPPAVWSYIKQHQLYGGRPI